MIKIIKLNKYFNRFKKNQIHVINNTSLDFPDHGLISLLGPSGCGKTTLLNTIGGLDNYTSGKIYINGKKMPKTSYFKDKLRVLNIGYIFQNYNLLDNLTVYDNISLSLRMIGIKDKKEINKKVNYVLEKVDMLRYKNRLCSNLSGGQRQRVGIARAIIKDPKVIIADEPTGNLDSKNTIEVMNIIKAISNDRLVILVTHEKDLAYFYSDRIISLEDGCVIKDELNNSDELDYKIDNRIYLKDLNKEEINNPNENINIYRVDNDKINLDIVLKNGNIYIKANKKIEVVDDDSAIEFIDDHYKKIKKEDYKKANFDLNIIKNNHKLRYTSIFNIFQFIKRGFKRVLDYSFLKKVLLIGFLFSSMFILFSISSIFGILNIKEKDYITENRNYLYLNSVKGNMDEYNKLKEKTDYIIPGNSIIKLSFIDNNLYQFVGSTLDVNASIDTLSSVKKIYGSYPKNDHEVIIDKMVYDRANQDDFNFKSYNILNYKDLIGSKFNIGNDTYTISGVTDNGYPAIYLNDYTDIIFDSLNNNDYSDDYSNISLKEGRMPNNDYETIVNISNKDDMKLNKEIDKKINNHKLNVVGYYTSNYNDHKFYVSKNTINILNISSLKGFTIKEENDIKDYLDQNNIKYENVLNKNKNDYLKNKKNSMRSTLIISGIILAVSLIEIFLMIRSSFMSKIKEAGIMRAIGIKKVDIYKMFSGEILVITTLTSIPGVIIMASFLKELSNVPNMSNMFLINKEVIIISFIIIYLFNLVIGLLPIFNVIRKTPAQILARNDID